MSLRRDRALLDDDDPLARDHDEEIARADREEPEPPPDDRLPIERDDLFEAGTERRLRRR